MADQPRTARRRHRLRTVHRRHRLRRDGPHDLRASHHIHPWPHAGRRVAVLSTRLSAGADPRICVYRTITDLVEALTGSGATRVYVDGGRVIQAFLAEGLVDELTITTVPLLMGSGIPLFGPLPHDVSLTHKTTTVLGAGLVQSTYTTAIS